ncbi:sigma-54 interaction domain-containing protein [Thermovenabulum gondwanense]|uniref:HTH-type transcriptional regulatory protein TyrR n=1 Tax=Thermovenabulum gondwanense TaxID=520767 RepID=A0A161Q1R8_9FIRM|nr:sigma 54-interacting transcriptional regulator [Thermovenabulum gondwanense]KYO64308.1 Formate hydrogenlyase transcriptional activator [Thermovenabulum gondwanense]
MDKRLLEIVVNNLYAGVYLTDGKGTTIGVNKTFEMMSGIKNEELTGKSMKELVEKGYFSASATLLVLERKAPASVIYNTCTKRRLLARGKPIFNEAGEIEYVVSTVYDLTEIEYKNTVDNEGVGGNLSEENNFVAYSEAMNRVIDLALRVAAVDSTVLIIGESGVGKSHVAEIIHRASKRRNRPMIKVNCAAIPETLIESELFGYEAGAFTGADKRGKPGLFELANHSTIFLDEVAEFPLNVQSKLLGVLQDMEFVKIGSRKPVKVDVRVIAATNKNLYKLVQEGKFREDLYYRLNVVPIHIPPLRERREDIPPLITYFVEKYNKKYGCNKILSTSLINLLINMPWEGNVRELENTIERLIVTSKSDSISIDDYNYIFRENDMDFTKMGLDKIMEEYEKRILSQAKILYKTTRKMAEALRTSQSTIVRKLKKYGII